MRSGFGLKAVPECSFASYSYVDDKIRSAKKRNAKTDYDRWHCNPVTTTSTSPACPNSRCWTNSLHYLLDDPLSGNLAKSHFPEVVFVDLVVVRLSVRSAPRKIDAVTPLTQPHAVEVRAPLVV